MNKGKEQKKIASLQVVRALAFMGVFAFHCEVTELGYWGVSVFILLSGFLMAHTYYDRSLPEGSLLGCMRFSLGKVRKLYFLHLFMFIICATWVYQLMLDKSSTKEIFLYWVEIVSNALLVQAWIPREDIYFSFNGVAWYLSLCIFLYAIFPRVMRGLRKLSKKNIILLAVEIYVLQVVLGVLSTQLAAEEAVIQELSKWFTYVCPVFRAGDFIIGCCLGMLYKNSKKEMGAKVATSFELLVVAGIILVQYLSLMPVEHFLWDGVKFTSIYTPLSVGLVYVFVIKKGLVSRLLVCKPLVVIGNLSPGAFLIHQVVIRGYDALGIQMSSTALELALKIGVSFGASMLVTWLYMVGQKRFAVKS